MWGFVSGIFGGGGEAATPPTPPAPAVQTPEQVLEEIRAKRLARLGGATDASGGATSSSSSSSSTTSSTPAHVATVSLPLPPTTSTTSTTSTATSKGSTQQQTQSQLSPTGKATHTLQATSASTTAPLSSVESSTSTPIRAKTTTTTPTSSSSSSSSSASVQPPTLPSSSKHVASSLVSTPNTSSPSTQATITATSPAGTALSSSSPALAVPKLLDERTVLSRILCMPADLANAANLSLATLRDELDGRLLQGPMIAASTSSSASSSSSSFSSCTTEIVQGVHANIVKASRTLPTIDYFVFLYNHAQTICDIKGPVKQLDSIALATAGGITTSTASATPPIPTTAAPEDVQDVKVLNAQLKQKIGTTVMDACIDYMSMVLGTDTYDSENVDRIFRRGGGGSTASSSSSSSSASSSSMHKQSLHLSARIQEADSSSAGGPEEHAGTRGLWALLVAATDDRTSSSSFSSAYSTSSGSIDAFLSVSSSLLQDVIVQLENLLGAGGVVDLLLPISWRLLRALQATSSFTNVDRTRAVSLVQTAVMCRPFARALVQTPAFSGHFSSFPSGVYAPSKKGRAGTSGGEGGGGAGNLPAPGGPGRFAGMVAQVSAMTTMMESMSSGGLGGGTRPNSGQHLQRNTILGCLLSPSPLPHDPPPLPGMPSHVTSMPGIVPSPVYDQFADLSHRNPREIHDNMNRVRMMQANVVDGALSVVQSILKADAFFKGIQTTAAAAGGGGGGPGGVTSTNIARDAVLSWIRDVLQANVDRLKENSGASQVSSDGFMLNLCIVIFKLCDPIVSGAKSQLCASSSSSTSSSLASSSTTTTTTTDKIALIDPGFLSATDSLFDLTAPRLVSVEEASTSTSSAATEDSSIIGAGNGSGTAAAVEEEEEDFYGDGNAAATSSSSSSSSSLLASSSSSSAPLAVNNTKRAVEADFSFITRIFFYSLRAAQLGLCQIIRKSRHEERMLSQLHYHARNRNDQGAQADFDYQLSNKVAMDTVRLDPDMLGLAIRVCSLACEWTGRLCGGANLGNTTNVATTTTSSSSLILPFPAEPIAPSRLVPESFVGTVVDVLDFVGSARDVTSVDDSATGAALSKVSESPFEVPVILSFFTALLASPKVYIRSPHLRAQMGDAIYGLFTPAVFKPGQEDEDSGGAGRGKKFDKAIYSSIHISAPSPFVAGYLAPALMELYGDVEATGYYEKTTHRMHVASVLNYVWSLPAHRAAFHSIAGGAGGGSNATTSSSSSSTDAAAFVSFANGIIGHTTAVLTEALKGLPVIRDTLLAMADYAGWNALTQEERDRRSAQLDTTVSSVKSSFLLTSQTTPLLAVLTQDSTICAAFMRGELVGRLAAMLLRGVTDLGGPRGIQLKVERPEQYGFKPRELLRDLLTAVLNLAAHEHEFVVAIAESGLWKSAEWEKVASIVERIHLLPQAGGGGGGGGGAVSLAALRHFIREVDQAVITAAEEAADLGDFPEEYGDPILCTLMLDPVKTPSGRVFDRSSIMQQLLNTPEDPFTRAPLNISDLVPDTELKGKITAWVRERRAEAAALKKKQQEEEREAEEEGGEGGGTN